MKQPERGRLIPVSGNSNTPDMTKAIDVQFNPTSLRVVQSNVLSSGEQPQSGKAAQYVSSSSSSMSIELVFDTTLPDDYVDEQASQDVRLLTRKIFEQFMQPGALLESGTDNKEPPSRCLFQWGAFEFVGMFEKFDETLDFFSPEGTPLRATLSLTLKEDTFQFRNRDVDRVERPMPTMTSTGKSKLAGSEETTRPIAGPSNNKSGNWRDTALYNGVENPRLPPGSEIANPGFSPGNAMNSASPAFRYGNSSNLGSTIEGAFGHSLGTGLAGGLSAESLREVQDSNMKGLQEHTDQSWMEGPRRAARDSGVGFD